MHCSLPMTPASFRVAGILLIARVCSGDPMTATTPDFTSEWRCGPGICADCRCPAKVGSAARSEIHFVIRCGGETRRRPGTLPLHVSSPGRTSDLESSSRETSFEEVGGKRAILVSAGINLSRLFVPVLHTIVDRAGQEKIRARHVAGTIRHRTLDRTEWHRKAGTRMSRDPRG